MSIGAKLKRFLKETLTYKPEITENLASTQQSLSALVHQLSITRALKLQSKNCADFDMNFCRMAPAIDVAGREGRKKQMIGANCRQDLLHHSEESTMPISSMTV